MDDIRKTDNTNAPENSTKTAEDKGCTYNKEGLKIKWTSQYVHMIAEIRRKNTTGDVQKLESLCKV